MDDTLWIAQSKDELEKITQMATSFYEMANLQINPTKSIFATNTKPTSIIFCKSTLNSIPHNQPFKYLGCWFTLNNKQTHFIKLIQEEAF